MFRRLFSEDMSIDLGTANTLVYVPGEGIVLDEPSVVAIRKYSDMHSKPHVEAVGTSAKKMIGRTPANIEVVRPLRDGVVADFATAEKMLQYFIRKASRRRLFNIGPRVLICVPCGATQVERRAIRAAAEAAGARKVYLYEEPLLAALGAGLDIEEPCGHFILDIGGGTSEVAVLSLNDIVYSDSSRIGGDHFNQSIIDHVRRTFGLLIGESTAEKVKHTIGSAYRPQTVEEMEIRGRDLSDGTPRSTTINSNEINDALQEPLQAILNKVHAVLEQTPPDLASDIMARGIVVTGGGALLTGIDELLMQELNVSVIIANEPLFCVARGGGKVLENNIPLQQDSSFFAH